MKLKRLLPLLLLLPAFGDPPVVPDATLSGLWFKITAKGKGRVIAHDGSSLTKASTSIPMFLHLSLDEATGPGDGEPPFTTYAFDEWTETTPGNWTSVSSGSVEVVVSTDKDYILPDLQLAASETTSELLLRATLLIHVKRDKSGELKSAKLSTLGCEAYFGSTLDGFFYGSAKLTGPMVDVAELPFTPP